MLLVNRSLLFTFSSQNCTSLIWKFCFCLKLTVQYGEDNSVGRNFCCTYIHKDVFFSYLLGHKATLSTATLSKIYFFNPPKKLIKFPWYNIKYRGKQDTTWNIPRSFTFFLLHFMLQYIAEKRFTSGLGRCTGLANILHLTLFLFVWDVEKFLFI